MSHFFGCTVVLSAVLSAASAFAGIEQAPPNFPHQVRGTSGEAVYVDFETARYSIVYDFAAKTVTAESDIEFVMPKRGFPIFDLVPAPSDLRLDHRPVSSVLTADPDGESRFHVIQEMTAPGRHRLTMKHSITTNVSFRTEGVASAFWMSDLSDREYLEQYLPSNFEYDQYAMSMRVEIVGAPSEHVIRANGVVRSLGQNQFDIEFPPLFTTSSMFYHLMPKSAVPAKAYEYKSIDGRSIPVEIYTSGGIERFETATNRILAELETDYGAFPHPKLVIYGAGMGGMEYSGATMTSLSALGHELMHSYNARGVMPAQGNSGWIDEAMSSWRDADYPARTTPGGTTRMAGHSKWTRMTDDDAYSKGAAFLAWIAGRMQTEGKSLKLFFREYFAKYMFKTTTTESFRAELEAYSGLALGPDFDRYIYGRSTTSEPRTPSQGSSWKSAQEAIMEARMNEACDQIAVEKSSAVPQENAYHPRLTKAQQLELLWP